jgi:hypothetical protein
MVVRLLAWHAILKRLSEWNNKLPIPVSIICDEEDGEGLDVDGFENFVFKPYIQF